MTLSRQHLGRVGEARAAMFLTSRSFTIIEQNYRTSFGEIDIIARKDDLLVFCEVRTRRLGLTVAVETIGESINSGKRDRLVRLAEFYLHNHPSLEGCACRFDVILVARQLGRWRLYWLEDAFRPGW
ncbi:MAG: YraN family protein [Magnetococcales bacterium]|nr:YraN family protein [Magnetococcales bacterium]